MTEHELLKLLRIVADRVGEAQSKYPETLSPQDRAFNEVKEALKSLQDLPGSCAGPFSEELPEDHSEVPWGWRVYGCGNHAHLIHLKHGHILVGRELAEKILVLGMP